MRDISIHNHFISITCECFEYNQNNFKHLQEKIASQKNVQKGK